MKERKIRTWAAVFTLIVTNDGSDWNRTEIHSVYGREALSTLLQTSNKELNPVLPLDLILHAFVIEVDGLFERSLLRSEWD